MQFYPVTLKVSCGFFLLFQVLNDKSSQNNKNNSCFHLLFFVSLIFIRTSSIFASPLLRMEPPPPPFIISPFMTGLQWWIAHFVGEESAPIVLNSINWHHHQFSRIISIHLCLMQSKTCDDKLPSNSSFSKEIIFRCLSLIISVNFASVSKTCQHLVEFYFFLWGFLFQRDTLAI